MGTNKQSWTGELFMFFGRSTAEFSFVLLFSLSLSYLPPIFLYLFIYFNLRQDLISFLWRFQNYFRLVFLRLSKLLTFSYIIIVVFSFFCRFIFLQGHISIMFLSSFKLLSFMFSCRFFTVVCPLELLSFFFSSSNLSF